MIHMFVADYYKIEFLQIRREARCQISPFHVRCVPTNSHEELPYLSIFSTPLTATCVSFTGIIGFVGLVAPHMVRLIIGEDYRYLIPSSTLLGALILLGSSTVGRTIISPVILPVGIVTSMLGAPMFIYLLLREGSRYDQG
ncbi:hypothetical protein B6U96_12405 [Archaeoglobales archaeon ex4484_92]|nr:MAG: hypothetical protein B6U96_12405 [Archaeoglobales archaeon ex4484_92]